MLTVTDYIQYCQANSYFTCGSSEQYNQAFLLVKMLLPSRGNRIIFKRVMNQLATATWICSDPDLGKSIADIESELYKLYLR